MLLMLFPENFCEFERDNGSAESLKLIPVGREGWNLTEI